MPLFLNVSQDISCADPTVDLRKERPYSAVVSAWELINSPLLKQLEVSGFEPLSSLFSNQASTCVVSYLSFAIQTQTNMVYHYYLKLVSYYILLRERTFNYPVSLFVSLTGIKNKQPSFGLGSHCKIVN